MNSSRSRRLFLLFAKSAFACFSFTPAVLAQSDEDFDKCGFLLQGQNCVVFESGGSYTLSEYGRFAVGDFVRVTGTLDEDCVSICDGVDGCIRGATVYDALVLPCGTELPSPEGIAADLCSTTTGALIGGLLMLAFTNRRCDCQAPISRATVACASGINIMRQSFEATK